MAKEDNLSPVQTVEEARERGRRGGIASGKARLRKKRGRELMLELLKMKEIDPKVLEELSKTFGLDPKDITKEIAMNARQIDKAIKKADTPAFKEVHRVAGTFDDDEKAGTTINVNVSPMAAKAAEKWCK